MKFDWVAKNRVTTLIVFGSFLIICIGIFLFFYTRSIPISEDFLTARKNAVSISKRITELTDTTNLKIKEVNLSELKGDTKKALELIEEAKTKNTEAYNQAFELSRQLQKLAASLSDIPSNSSQRLAYEATAIELSLVSEFISYTQSLNEFLDVLRISIATNSSTEQFRIRNLVIRINESATTINKLNKSFITKMDNFDKSL